MIPDSPEQKSTAIFIGKLFLAFLKLGLTAFGGPAMVAYIRVLAVRKNGWLTEESFRHGVAVCQSIPGATAMQVAAYVGLRAGGAFGAVATYVGFGFPAFLLMVAMAALYNRAHDLAAVVSAFLGLQVIVVALVANATVSFGRSTIKKWQDMLLGLGAAAFLATNGSPIVVIIVSALLGLILYRKEAVKQKDHISSTHGPLLKNLGAPLFLTLVLAAGLLALFCLDRQLFDLAAMMVKIDLFAFGGGYASVPFMLHEVVDVRHWMDSKTFMDGIALGQVTPGPIVITATFIGYLIAGVPGALVGTISILTPSLIILTAVVPYFDRLQSNALFQRGFRGVLVSFVGLLLAVTVRFALSIDWSVYQVLIASLAFLALRLKVDILWVVVIGAVVSALIL
ncbi:MAG: chromate efflux transporter [Desulfobulbaceae bacterium]|nr:chromate efflux transporter [Desulfobulbaceae bacterium]